MKSENESESDLEVDRPPLQRTKQRQRIAELESESEDEITPLRRTKQRQRIAESELVEERPPFKGQQERECRATNSHLNMND